MAVTEVEILEIPFLSLDPIYSKVPEYLKTIIVAMAERLRKANDTIRRLTKAEDAPEPKGKRRTKNSQESADSNHPPVDGTQPSLTDVLTSIAPDDLTLIATMSSKALDQLDEKDEDPLSPQKPIRE